ncbi:hypothetical protein EV384_2544 [Micromonospora kangleipakensis]|uniref:Uncharacterized protein n=1 Tax=Micromonospora kangleipakensis TaxID=1077942 RepID=A0A4Q8B8Q7_9ACTN|nr:hypothetical protein [Micromonospora kangleipakensis]RZU74102.1 hypothetical protein EV384_2544 [Micromonospora kangleipakensis]
MADDRSRRSLPVRLGAPGPYVLAALILFALLVAGSVRWAAIYGLVAAVCLGVAALTLCRVRRLDRRLTAPSGQRG